jgi:transposase InsO family protein
MAFGTPKRIYTDNGREFSSIHNVCAQWGIELVKASPMRPTTMGKAERFFRQIDTRLIRHLPGYRGKRRTNRHADETTHLSLAELQDQIEHFIQQWNYKQGAQE